VEDEHVIETTIRYVDRIFGPGMGKRHAAFLDKLENRALREMVHRYHGVEEDTKLLSLAENYLLGMCVLFATKNHGTASMFAKMLLHLGTPKPKILEAIARMGLWVGPLAAAEAAFQAQRALREYEADGIGSLGAWFPPGEEG
jgi:hypothetical protein